jgi:hypothetical protein
LQGETPVRKRRQKDGHNDSNIVRTYETSSGLNLTTLGENKQAIDYGSKPLHQFGIAILGFLKLLNLFLEYGKEGFGGFAAIDLGGQRVAAEIVIGLPGILG